jgi:hypothetical protein
MNGIFDLVVYRITNLQLIAFAVALAFAFHRRAAYPRPSRLAMSGFGLLLFSNLVVDLFSAYVIARRNFDGPPFFISGEMAMWFLSISRVGAMIFLLKAVYAGRRMPTQPAQDSDERGHAGQLALPAPQAFQLRSEVSA